MDLKHQIAIYYMVFQLLSAQSEFYFLNVLMSKLLYIDDCSFSDLASNKSLYLHQTYFTIITWKFLFLFVATLPKVSKSS